MIERYGWNNLSLFSFLGRFAALVDMLVRCPRRLALFSFTAFLCIISVLQQSPWARTIVYEQIPLFHSPQSGLLNTHNTEQQDAPSPSRPPPPWATTSIKSNTPAYTPLRPAVLRAYMLEMLNWSRPTWEGHWPPFADYIDKDYDPNRWEQFDM